MRIVDSVNACRNPTKAHLYVARATCAVSPSGETGRAIQRGKKPETGRGGVSSGAIYHLSAHDRVSRSAGQSSVASAAYMMRAKFTDERTGMVSDFRHLGAPDWMGLFSPKDAPEWTRNIDNAERFWNALELFEKRKDSQIALPLDIAMPHALTLQQNIWLAQDYIREFTRQGYVVLACIHPPDHDERNIHLHLLVSLRKIDKDGFARSKAEQQDNFRNREAYVESLREKWEQIANRHLERHGIDARIDRRTLQEQGIDRAPQKHRGPSKAAVVFLEQDRKARAAALAEIKELQAKIIDLDAAREARQRAQYPGRADSHGQQTTPPHGQRARRATRSNRNHPRCRFSGERRPREIRRRASQGRRGPCPRHRRRCAGP